MTVLYSEDFSGYTPYASSSTAGWSGSSATLFPSPTAKMGTQGGTDGYGERTFATGGTLSYDWGSNEGSGWVKVYVAGVLQKTHNGSATGSDTVSVGDGETVKFEFNTDFGDSYVDNLSLESVTSSYPLYTSDIRSTNRVESPHLVVGATLETKDIRTGNRVATPILVAKRTVEAKDVRGENRVASPDVTFRLMVSPENARSANRVQSPGVVARKLLGVADARSANRVAATGDVLIGAILAKHVRSVNRIKPPGVVPSGWVTRNFPRRSLLLGGGLLLGD